MGRGDGGDQIVRIPRSFPLPNPQGAAWRGPKDRDLDRVCEMVSGVKELGLETCATLGLLKNEGQAERLREAGRKPGTETRKGPKVEIAP